MVAGHLACYQALCQRLQQPRHVGKLALGHEVDTCSGAVGRERPPAVDGTALRRCARVREMAGRIRWTRRSARIPSRAGLSCARGREAQLWRAGGELLDGRLRRLPGGEVGRIGEVIEDDLGWPAYKKGLLDAHVWPPNRLVVACGRRRSGSTIFTSISVSAEETTGASSSIAGSLDLALAVITSFAPFALGECGRAQITAAGPWDGVRSARLRRVCGKRRTPRRFRDAPYKRDNAARQQHVGVVG